MKTAILLSLFFFSLIIAPARASTPITIGVVVSPAMTVLVVAKEKGFFQHEGLNVEIKQFTAGKFALQTFLSHSVDYAVSGEVPVCLAALEGNSVKVVSQVVEKTMNSDRIIALRESNLSSATQYFNAKRRRLATSFGAGPEFFTYNFLKTHRIDPKNVELLSLRPEDMPTALETKSVDAIATYDPYTFIAEQQMGKKAITFQDHSDYSELFVLTAHPEQSSNDGKTIEAMLRALKRASDFTAKHPDDAKLFMQRFTKLDRNTIDGIWKNFSFKLALTKKLLHNWNAEALWAKETHKVSPNAPPLVVKDMIEPRFLRKVSPNAVNL